jgi:hypothetical protein
MPVCKYSHDDALFAPVGTADLDLVTGAQEPVRLCPYTVDRNFAAAAGSLCFRTRSE